MQHLIGLYASLLQRNRHVVTTVLVLGTLLLVSCIFRLRSDLQLVGGVALDRAGESQQERELMRRTENSCVVMLNGDDLFSSRGVSLIRRLDKELSAIVGVDNVESLFDMHVVHSLPRRSVFLMLLPSDDATPERIAKFKDQALDNPVATGQLISDDGKTTSFTVMINPSISAIEDLRKVMDQIYACVDNAIAGTSFQTHFTGMPEIRVQASRVVVNDQIIFNVVGALTGVLVNLFLLRRVAAVAIVTVGAWLGVVWTFGLFGLMGQPLTPINGIVAPLAMTIGLTDSIHLVLDIRRMRAKGLSRVDATIAAVRDVGLACTLTSVTTVIGFLSLRVANLEVLRNLGFCCAVAVISAYLTVLMAVPLLAMTRLGDHIDVPPADPERQQASATLAFRLARGVLAHRWKFFVGGVVCTLFLAVVSMRLHSDNRLSYALPERARQALDFSDEAFGGTIPVILHVTWDETAKPTPAEMISLLEETHGIIAKSENMSRPLSLLNVLELYPEAKDQGKLAAFAQLKHWPSRARDQRDLAIDFRERSMYVYMRSKDAGSYAIARDLNHFDALQRKLTEKYSGFHFRVLKSVATSAPIANQIISDLMMSMMLAVPVTLGLMAWSMGSVYFAFAGFLPNVFPMLALAASLVLCGQPLILVGAVVFTFSFGVAVDDTIHVLNNYQRLSRTEADVTTVISNVYQKVGGALVASTLILLAGMGVVILSRTLLVRAFGAMFCVSLAFALVADLIILPATLACFPYRPGKRRTRVDQPDPSPME